jgi:hypothetical protein
LQPYFDCSRFPWAGSAKSGAENRWDFGAAKQDSALQGGRRSLFEFLQQQVPGFPVMRWPPSA